MLVDVVRVVVPPNTGRACLALYSVPVIIETMVMWAARREKKTRVV